MWKLLNVHCLLLFTLSIQANDNNPTTLAQAEKWLSTANEKGFLENKGQMMDNEGKPVPQVLFKTEAPDLNIWITETGLTIQILRLRKEPIPESELSEFEKEEVKRIGKAKTKKYFDWERVDIDLKGATIKKENIVKENPLQGHDNYFYPTCPDGIYGVKEYEKITIKDVYPGIDWVLYRKHTPNPSQEGNNEGGFKYDFIVHPVADYQQIELIYKSKTPININEQGELEMFTIYGNVKENKPVSFYENQEIATRFIQNYQKPTTINEDLGYETSISFHLATPPLPSPSSSRLDGRGVGGGLLVIDPQLVWGTLYGGNGNDGFMAIDIDNNGNSFITGYTTSNNFPTQNAGTFFQGTFIGGATDAFLLKFDNTGNWLWATYYGGNGDDRGNSITTDGLNNVWVTGWTSSNNFPTQTASTFFQGSFGGGFNDIFLLKFDNAGNRMWATYYGGSGDDEGNSITTDGLNNVWVTGQTYSPDFPTQTASTFFQGTFGGGFFPDAFLLKFDNASNRLWATYYGGSGDDKGNSLITDGLNNVWVTGQTTSANFPTQNVGSFFQGAFGGGGFSGDAFLLKFDNAGNRLWATYYGGSGDDVGTSITTDGLNNVWVTGQTQSTDFPVQNTGTFFQGAYGGVQDVFLLKFDNAGNRLWATYYGGSGGEGMGSFDVITVDNCNNVYVVFNTRSTNITTFSAAPCHYLDNSFGGGVFGDVFLVEFDNAGNLLWSTYIGGDGNDFRGALAIDAANNLFVVGEFTSYTTSATLPMVTLGGGTYFQSTPGGGIDDSFVLKFAHSLVTTSQSQTNASFCTPCNGEAIAEVVTTCGIPPYSFTWSTGATKLNTTAMSDTLSNLCAGNYWVEIQSNCSIDTLFYTLTGLAVSTSTDIQTACNSLTWLDGITYTATTSTPTFTIAGGAANGCDSVVTLNLTINSNADTDIQTACDSYVWIDGITYTTSTNTPTFTLMNSFGCDSIVTLNLTINSATTGIDSITSCTPITWIDGVTYAASTNLSTFTLTNTAGCDSIVTLNLTINNSTTSTDVQTACNTYTWIDGNIYTTNNNTTTHTLTNVAGCDSIVTLDLTILTPTKTSQNFVECQGFSITVGSNTYTTTGVFTDVINGCDTIITNLTINDAPQFTLIKEDDNCGEHIGSVFVNVTSSIPPVTYIWNTGSNDSIISNLPAGTYTVTVNDGSGCSNANTINVLDLKLDCEFFIFIPSVFTPNGDGQNDEFIIQLKGLEFISLEIYNRWGIKLFESTQKNRGWDGRTETDTKATDGTYFYIVSYKTTDDEIMTKKGTLTLLR